jgi:hypothetical protein
VLRFRKVVYCINWNNGKIYKSEDPLAMSYFDNLDNESLNKYKKNLKNRKKVYRCVLLPLD